MRLIDVIFRVHQGRGQNVQLVRRVTETPPVVEAILSFAEQRGMMLQVSVRCHAPAV